MPIIPVPYDILFAHSYQSTYINKFGYIDVGPNTYSVFHNYTPQQRQQIFQVCEKYIPWQFTDLQEDWERTAYMYQFIIKSPPPFPYPQYTLSKDIIMAKNWILTIESPDVGKKEATITAVRIDDTDPNNIIHEIHKVENVLIDTAQSKQSAFDQLWNMHLAEEAKQNSIRQFIGSIEKEGAAYLEGRET